MSPMWSPTAEEDVLFVIALYATSSGLSLQVLNSQWVVLGIFFSLTLMVPTYFSMLVYQGGSFFHHPRKSSIYVKEVQISVIYQI